MSEFSSSALGTGLFIPTKRRTVQESDGPITARDKELIYVVDDGLEMTINTPEPQPRMGFIVAIGELNGDFTNAIIDVSPNTFAKSDVQTEILASPGISAVFVWDHIAETWLLSA